jgi:hypothetical protein
MIHLKMSQGDGYDETEIESAQDSPEHQRSNDGFTAFGFDGSANPVQVQVSLDGITDESVHHPI